MKKFSATMPKAKFRVKENSRMAGTPEIFRVFHIVAVVFVKLGGSSFLAGKHLFI
jgi:hypothetical protein